MARGSRPTHCGTPGVPPCTDIEVERRAAAKAEMRRLIDARAHHTDDIDLDDGAAADRSNEIALDVELGVIQ